MFYFYSNKLLNSIMLTYFIAGVPKYPDFGHAKLIAEKLKHSLPYFSYKVIAITEEDYQVMILINDNVYKNIFLSTTVPIYNIPIW